MSSAPKPPALLPAGRMKWLWIAIAGAVGLWLILLLMVSGPDDEKKPASERGSQPKSFDTPATEAFSKRPPVKSVRPLPSFPVAPDQRKSE
jgi:hypothetical protein